MNVHRWGIDRGDTMPYTIYAPLDHRHQPVQVQVCGSLPAHLPSIERYWAKSSATIRLEWCEMVTRQVMWGWNQTERGHQWSVSHQQITFVPPVPLKNFFLPYPVFLFPHTVSTFLSTYPNPGAYLPSFLPHSPITLLPIQLQSRYLMNLVHLAVAVTFVFLLLPTLLSFFIFHYYHNLCAIISWLLLTSLSPHSPKFMYFSAATGDSDALGHVLQFSSELSTKTYINFCKCHRVWGSWSIIKFMVYYNRNPWGLLIVRALWLRFLSNLLGDTSLDPKF